MTHSADQGSDSYARRLRHELAHYGALLAAQGPGTEVQQIEPKVPAFEHAMRLYNRYTKSKMPHVNLEAYAAEYVEMSPRTVRLLSLGAGTGDWELAVARRAPQRVEVTLVDINEDLMRGALAVAERDGIVLRTLVEDVNSLGISPHAYDLIVCRSSLHHFIALEHILTQIKGGLSTGGEFLVIGEVIGRNGLMLYPETEQVAQAVFSALPARLRFNHYTKLIDDTVPNIDHSREMLEAIRSEEILPLLLQSFTPVQYVTFDAFVSLLLDWRYGPNYDMSQEMDRTVVSLITELDIQLVANGILRPTALFGIFR